MTISINHSEFSEVHIKVHPLKLILHKRTKVVGHLFGYDVGYVNELYDYKDYLKLVGDLKEYEQNENIINSVIQYLKDNCMEVNILETAKVKNKNIKKEDTNQLSLF